MLGWGVPPPHAGCRLLLNASSLSPQLVGKVSVLVRCASASSFCNRSLNDSTLSRKGTALLLFELPPYSLPLFVGCVPTPLLSLWTVTLHPDVGIRFVSSTSSRREQRGAEKERAEKIVEETNKEREKNNAK